MNKKEIFKVVLIAIVGTGVAGAIVNMLLGDINEKTAQYNDVEVVEASVGIPDPEIFNEDTINPTVDVYVGNCPDTNGNGVLDHDELVNCSRGQ